MLRLRRPEHETRIEIMPLIDVIFLLVLFFMFTSTFIEEAKVFQIVLPKADQPTVINRDDADSVGLTIDGKIYFRGTAGEEEEVDNLQILIAKLKERDESGQKRPVIIRCDARCEYQEFVKVKNALKLAGVETIFEEVEIGQR